MVTRDRLWKAIIEEFFSEFLLFFFEDYVHLVDFEKGFVFLDKELKQLYPESEQEHKRADILVKVFLKDGTEHWILIHIEVQGYKDKNFPERVFTYAYRGMDRFKVKVATLVILTDSNKNWRPDRFEYKCFGTTQSYRFPIFKLSDYKAEDFENSDNIFAIIMQTALLALNKKWTDEELLAEKLKIVEKLVKKGFTRTQSAGLLNFIKFYVRFVKKENFHKFETGVEIITQSKAKKSMTVVETVLDAAKEAGQKVGLRKGIKKGLKEGTDKTTLEFTKTLLIQFPSWADKQIALLVNKPEPYVKKVRAGLNKKKK